MTATRRLTAILAADVAGYSRLMGADEEGTHEGLRAHLREQIEPNIAEHRGRIVKNTGDGFLAEFQSVVDAVRCAVEVQRGMADRNAATPPDKRIEFRVGINLGDVIAEEHDIFGDGVNIAARLEGLAEPGGICVSRVVRDQVRDRLDFAFEDLGEQQVKNIARPVRVFALRPEAIAELTPAVVFVPTSRGRRGALAVLVAGAGSALAVTVIAGWIWPAVRSIPAVTANRSLTESLASPAVIVKPLVAPRLSILVLPFANLSDDQEQQYLADGITDDLTTDLSRITESFVIARNTAFTFKDKSVDVKQIGRELGVRYVVEGSVRRFAEKVRINAQLVDAQTGAHIWAELFDRGLDNLFDVQNEITGRIARSLQSQLVIAEAGRSTGSSDAVDYILRGRAALTKPISRETYAEAESLFEHALSLDPRDPEAQIGLARVLVARALDDLSSSFSADVERADSLITRALAGSPDSAWAHHVKGQVRRAQFRHEEAIPEYETVISLDRNFADAYAYLGWCKLVTGALDEVMSLVQQAIRLSPRDPYIATWYFDLGALHLLQSRVDDAIIWLEKARNAYGAYPYVFRWLTAAYGLKGDTDRAAAALREARKLSDVNSSIARLSAAPSQRWLQRPKIRPLAEANFWPGLRKAGMPEE
jgi:adenylate cyclase